MLKNILKSKRVSISASILLLMFIVSLLFPLYESHLPKGFKMQMDENGTLIGMAPFSPKEFMPLGTDKSGEPMLNKVIDGIKYTLVFAVFVAFFRLVFSVFIGVSLEMYGEKLNKYIKKIGIIFYCIPTIFLAIIFNAPMYYTAGHGEVVEISMQWKVLYYQLILFICIGIPSLAMMISEETRLCKRNEYVTSSVTMGASKWRIARTHVWIYLKDKLPVLFVQQVVQALVLFIYLGVLGILIGGSRSENMDDDITKAVSLTSELSGLIAGSYNDIFIAPWIILAPLIAFSLIIYLLNQIVEGMQEVLSGKQKFKKISEVKPKLVENNLTAELFEFANIKSQNGEMQ